MTVSRLLLSLRREKGAVRTLLMSPDMMIRCFCTCRRVKASDPLQRFQFSDTRSLT